ncbi:MAG: DUF2007 domain-containing protein [Isosphaeraceae bacterium]|nr:DUF2007 domain-containing protein [Isosphaeraceae bacterium]
MSIRLDRTLYYCPRCERRSENGPGLCPNCGDTCRIGGFCPICDQSLPVAIGAPCPKHDLPLLDPVEADAEPPGSESVELALIRAFTDETEAGAARVRLEAEGIPTFLDSARMGSRSFYSNATGGVKLLVPRELEADARVILDQVWTVPETEDEIEEDAFENLAPDPAAWRRSVMKRIILVIIFGPVVLTLLGVLLERLGR